MSCLMRLASDRFRFDQTGSQALAGLVFPAGPGAQVCRRASMTGQVSSRHLAILSSSRSAARRAGTALIGIPAPCRARVQHRLELGDLGGAELALRAGRPLEASASRPPAASALRHRFALIRETRKCFATSRSLAPASIISAAASRTRSRRARSAASRPPPSGYLTPPA